MYNQMRHFMSNMKIKVHESNKIPDSLETLVEHSLDYALGHDRIVVIIQSPENGSREFVTTLFDMDGMILDNQETNLYDAVHYFKGTAEDIAVRNNVDSLTYYR